jgi:predicted NBD/HSP70 family sugar kinase
MKRIERIPVTSPAEVAIFQNVLMHGPVPRVELARSLGLSQAIVTKAARSLIESGHLIESEDPRQSPFRGRPVMPLQVRADRAHAIGFKIVDNHVYGVLTDMNAAVLARSDTPIDTRKVNAVVDALEHLTNQLRNTHPEILDAGVGIAVSGDIDPTSGVVRHSPLMGWKDVPLGQEVSKRLGTEILVDNDVHALTRFEHIFGLGRGAMSFALMTIGAGIGCGVFVNGDLIRGAHGVSGEIGHLPLSPENLLCSCGRRGCVETIAASESILRKIREISGNPELTFPEAVAAARRGEPGPQAVFDEAGELLGKALATLVNLVGPERVVLSGEGVENYDLFLNSLHRGFKEHVFSSTTDLELSAHQHSVYDWAIGAATTVIWSVARGF